MSWVIDRKLSVSESDLEQALMDHVLLDNVEFRKVIPSDYRLFQIADLVCTLQLLEFKCDNHTLSNSEKRFFKSERVLKKNYIKPLKQKMME